MILIAYKSHTGTTKEAAEVLQNVFVSKKLDVEVLEISEIKSVDQYDLIIIGAPINGMHWLSEASKFVLTHEITLKKKKVACFTLSYIINDGRKFWKNRVRKNFKRACQFINPIDMMIFGGSINQQLPTPARLIFGISKNAPLDYRENKKIEDWGKFIINDLK